MVQVKLPKTVSGKELVDLIEETAEEMSIFYVKTKSDFEYTYGSVKQIESKRRIEINKKTPILKRIQHIEGIVWCGSPEVRIVANINIDKKYDTIDVGLEHWGWPEIKAFNKKVQEKCYSVLEDFLEKFYIKFE